MKRHDGTCSQWLTDNGRVLLRLNRLAEPDQTFSVAPAFASLDELRQLGEAIKEALIMIEEEPKYA